MSGTALHHGKATLKPNNSVPKRPMCIEIISSRCSLLALPEVDYTELHKCAAMFSRIHMIPASLAEYIKYKVLRVLELQQI